MRWRLIAIMCLVPVVAAAAVLWILNGRVTNHWLSVHTGLNDLSGPYYGFWSGFGSDLAEFGIIAGIGTGVYQLVRKYNCHEPGCWRVGTHPAAGGQFLLCYRHHPDFAGKKPTHELIERLHQQQAAQQAAIHERLERVHDHLQHAAVQDTQHDASEQGLPHVTPDEGAEAAAKPPSTSPPDPPSAPD